MSTGLWFCMIAISHFYSSVYFHGFKFTYLRKVRPLTMLRDQHASWETWFPPRWSACPWSWAPACPPGARPGARRCRAGCCFLPPRCPCGLWLSSARSDKCMPWKSWKHEVGGFILSIKKWSNWEPHSFPNYKIFLIWKKYIFIIFRCRYINSIMKCAYSKQSQGDDKS